MSIVSTPHLHSMVRAEPVLRLRNFHPHRPPAPPTRLCGERAPREIRQNLPVDALRQDSQDGAVINESEKRFSFPRAALSMSGRAKANSGALDLKGVSPP